MDTSEGIAIRIGKDQADVQRELDKLVECGILLKTGKKEYFDHVFPMFLEQRRRKTQDKPKMVSPIEPASLRLLQQVAPDSQREIELTCIRLLQQVAIESEFEITSLKVIEAIETLEAAAIPALIEIGNRAANHAVRTYAHDTIMRIIEARKESKQTNPEHSQITSLNCPNCGGVVPRGTLNASIVAWNSFLPTEDSCPETSYPAPNAGTLWRETPGSV